MSYSTLNVAGSATRIDWRIERDRLDLAQVATDLMGQPPGRGRKQGLWWVCPFHDDQNPSLQVDSSRQRWKCFGCGANGDAATLLMRLHNLNFPESIRRLLGSNLASNFPHSTRTPRTVRPVEPSGLSPSEASSLVVESHDRLWTLEGANALQGLICERHLTEATIRQARLGWTPCSDLTTRDGRTYRARGIVIPWHFGERLALVKIRQPPGSTPKYSEAFRNGPTFFSGTMGSVEPGLPLVVVEGEFDALLLGQELAGLALVVSFGPASIRPDLASLDQFARYRPWYAAHDADAAGDAAAAQWPATTRRVRPPGSFKDWTEMRQGGVNLRRWWTDRLLGYHYPELYTWPELEAWRW